MKFLSILSFLLGSLLLQCTSSPEPTNKDIAQNPVVEKEKNITAPSQPNPCIEFHILNTQIRDGQITEKEAKKEILRLLPLIKTYYENNGGNYFDPAQWVFPVKGYSSTAIGGTNGSGYISKDYNYFDGNKHGGHPAHDIFIRDKNQDNLDDKTLEEVEVLSISGGVVVAMETEWDTTSNLRGGKYIWILEPKEQQLFYYAHNSNVKIGLGSIVKPGEAIATVGRTGLNAFKKRSPTHLHVSMLQISAEGIPVSQNLYNYLLSASKKI